MSKISIHTLVDSTASLIIRRAENADFVSFMSAAPALPAAVARKPQPREGKPAYSSNGARGIWGAGDTVTITVKGRAVSIFARRNEWSSEPWTVEEREDFSGAQIERAQAQSEIDRSTRDAWKKRRSLARSFTGR